MNASYHQRIPSLEDEALMAYVKAPLAYQTEAVEMALEELARRGGALTPAEAARIRLLLQQRDAARLGRPRPWVGRLLGTTPAIRKARIRWVTAAIVGVGLGAAFAIRQVAGSPSPAGFEPEDSKRYLRDLEMYGGKINVVATEIRLWFAGLWEGGQLGTTVGWLSLLLAAGFWFTAQRLPVEAEPPGSREFEP
jgi:hypothetical protein